MLVIPDGFWPDQGFFAMLVSISWDILPQFWCLGFEVSAAKHTTFRTPQLEEISTTAAYPPSQLGPCIGKKPPLDLDNLRCFVGLLPKKTNHRSPTFFWLRLEFKGETDFCLVAFIPWIRKSQWFVACWSFFLCFCPPTHLGNGDMIRASRYFFWSNSPHQVMSRRSYTSLLRRVVWDGRPEESPALFLVQVTWGFRKTGGDSCHQKQRIFGEILGNLSWLPGQQLLKKHGFIQTWYPPWN